MSEHRTHHNTCPRGERCACYLTGYTDSEYDHGHARDTLEPAKSELASSTGYLPSSECCADWKRGIEKLNGPILLAQARNPHLTATPEFQFKPFSFCPWCGQRKADNKQI